ncbi:unnamed protein product [Oikopleura dioica]|uniref:Uncharacterized protein n=1 Tax=Oikopleura dioica TaxID=34765 RepID=E4WTK0_OIKDI|nr:unnamed protein product [Oikopleura dioica]
MPGCLLLNHTNKEMELIDDLFEDYVDSFCDVFVGIIPQLMLPMEIAHAILTAKIVKKSWKKESLRKYTLASFIIFLLVAGGNTVLLNLLTFRNPILFGFSSSRTLFINCLSWWLICFTPENAFEAFCSNKTSLFFLAFFKELFRAKKTFFAAEIGFIVYQGNLILASLVGLVGAMGCEFMQSAGTALISAENKEIEKIANGDFTKVALFFSSLYVLAFSGCEITPGNNLIITSQSIVMFALAFSSKIGKTVSVFKTIDEIFFKILTFGSDNKEKQV